MVEIRLLALPSERYKRNVIRGKLDLVGEHSIEIVFHSIHVPTNK